MSSYCHYFRKSLKKLITNKQLNFYQLTSEVTIHRTHSTYVCVSGVRNIWFSENLARFVFLKHPFSDLPFCLITDEKWFHKIQEEKLALDDGRQLQV